MKQIRILLVGDEAVGKTAIIERFINDTFLITHSPTVVNEYVKYSKNYQLHIRDSSGLPAFQSLRYLQYAQVDVILLCFNEANLGSFDNLKRYWLPEIRNNCPDAILILVGCKSDLKYAISEMLIIKTQSELNVKHYVKCSAKNNDHVDAIFNAAVNAYLVKTKTTKSSKKIK